MSFITRLLSSTYNTGPRQKGGYSVGVELECIFACSPENRATKEKRISKCLNEFAELVRGGVSGYDVVVVPGIRPSALTDAETELVTKNFVVGRDYTIKAGNQGFPIEITTPVLTNGSWNDVIPRLMEHLQSTGKITFNYSTGLHIHIGTTDKEGNIYTERFTCKELQQIAKAVLLFEKQISTLHPTRDPLGEHGVKFYQYCGENALLSKLDMKQKIEVIASLPSNDVNALLNCINYTEIGFNRNFVFNFGSIVKYDTIESRQPAGTLDHEWILDLITRTISLIENAIETSDEQFLDWATNGISDPGVYKKFGVPAPI